MWERSLGRLGVMVGVGCLGCGAVRYDPLQSMGSSGSGQSAGGSGSAGQAFGGAGQAIGGTGAEQAIGGAAVIDPETSAGAPSQGGAPFVGTCRRLAADPAQTAKYRWHECGRIPATASPLAALYAKDGSVLVLNDAGRVQMRALGSQSLTPLIDIQLEQPGRFFLDETGAVLSDDGRTLLVWNGTLAYAYRSSSELPIGAGSAALQRVSMFNAGLGGCAGRMRLSPDGAFALNTRSNAACVWDVDHGQLRSSLTLELPPQGSLGLTRGTAPLRVFEGTAISNYTLSGALESTMPVAAVAAANVRVGWSAFTPDSAALILELSTDTELALVAVDANTGKLRWQQLLDPKNFVGHALNNEFVVMTGDKMYRVSDGSPAALQVPKFVSFVADVGARRALLLSEQVLEWSADGPSLGHVYGAHTSAIQSLDLSRDGRYLASQGHGATVWEIDPDFSHSKARFTSGLSYSRNVAISPRGDAMITSGDNPVYHTRDGAYREALEDTPVANLDCLSGTWAFSPDGKFAAGTRYAPIVELRGVPSFAAVSGLAASNCSGGVAFSADGSRLVTASLELLDTATGHPIWSHAEPQRHASGVADSVDFAPDCSEVVRTRCDDQFDGACRSARYDAATGTSLGDLSELQGDRVRYAPDGQWLVSKGRLLHVPTGTAIDYSTAASVALFTPQGDLISGEKDGSLVQYCRSAQ